MTAEKQTTTQEADAPDDDLLYIDAEEREESRRRRALLRHAQRSETKVAEGHTPLVPQSDASEERITTYQPSRHERGWLLSSLGDFYEQELITDVLASVKGGKEASVYRCQTAPRMVDSIGSPFVAAKVYRPRPFRNLRNDVAYREGRAVLTADGTAVKRSDGRVMRALGKKTAFGQQVQHTSWLMYEYTTLDTLHRAGASVPKPIAAGENALLMGYIGDADRAAPTLIETSVAPDEARFLFREVLRNIKVLLSLDMIHGDLSAYNILYWQGNVTLIDFPQVVNRNTNPRAEEIFTRDVTRVCEYFARNGVVCDSPKVASDLWNA